MTLKINDSGTWKEPTKVSVKDGGAWKEVLTASVKDGGSWKPFIKGNILIQFQVMLIN